MIVPLFTHALVSLAVLIKNIHHTGLDFHSGGFMFTEDLTSKYREVLSIQIRGYRV